MNNLHSRLANPILQQNDILSQTVLDLAVYLEQPTIEELRVLVELYRQFCPPDRFRKYKIAELSVWDEIATPYYLTIQGRQARQTGEPLPFLAPVRTRIAAGRPFELQFWDEQKLNPYAFSLRQIRLEDELHCFSRILMPIDDDADKLWDLAQQIADQLKIISGHGGLVFGYNPGKKHTAFTHIYPLAARWWGIDVEDLNRTLPLMKTGIKGVNWITMVGPAFLQGVQGTAPFEDLKQAPDITLVSGQNALLIRAGDKPAPCDRNRPDQSMAPYVAVARALEPLHLKAHPGFSGDGFIDHGNTLGWYRRFLDPTGWP